MIVHDRRPVLVWDVNEAPKDRPTTVWHWRRYDEENGVASVPRYVEENADRLRATYIAFAYDLGERQIRGRRVIDHLDAGDGFSFWWMTRLSEKSPFKSRRIFDCLRMMALEEMIRQHEPAELALCSDDRELADAIRTLCSTLCISFVWEKVSGSKGRWSLRRVYDAMPHTIQGVFSLRHVALRWRFRDLRAKWFSGTNAVFLCSAFFNLDWEACKAGRFHARQWEALPRYLKERGKNANWIHHYLADRGLPDVRTTIDWTRRLNRDAKNQGLHVFLETYLTFGLIIRALKTWCWLHVVAWRLREIRHGFSPQGWGISLWPLLKDDWKNSMCGTAAVSNCLWAGLFDAALKDMPRQGLGFYLWENQGWECALVAAWRRHGHGRIIGVPHSTMPFWYLNIYDDPREVASSRSGGKPKPDCLALNGPMAWKALAVTGYPTERLSPVEALRFQYLLGLAAAAPEQDARRSHRNLRTRAHIRLLILGDFNLGQTLRMLSCVDAAAQELEMGLSVTLKPHPVCPLAQNTVGNLQFKVTERPLSDIVAGFDFAFSSNTTSAGLDALLSGLPVAVFLDDDDFNHSPLRGVEKVTFVSNGHDLAAALHNHELDDLPSPIVDDFFWLNDDLPLWGRLIGAAEIDPCLG